MLHKLQAYEDAAAVLALLQEADAIFRYCSFSSLQFDGGSNDAVSLSCTFTGVDWYWTLFNRAVFASCRFERCVFRGVAFPDSRFVECTFVDCQFTKDNLGGDCRFDDAKWYDCTQENCVGIPDSIPIVRAK